MTVFADSSALVKLYADEPGHEAVREEPTYVVSQLARVEVPSALWRKVRTRELEAADAGVLVAEFEADYSGADGEEPRLVAVLVTAAILDVAARLSAVHGLRAYDAVQLASALAAREVEPRCSRLAAFDAGLRSAAAAEGWALLPA